MKKCSKLLIFAFLISHAFMKDCSSEATCAGTKENGNDDIINDMQKMKNEIVHGLSYGQKFKSLL